MKINKSTKSFGYLFCVVFFLIGFYPILNNETFNLYFLIIGLLFGILGYLNSKILFPFKKAWIKFGEILGKVISPIILFIIYFIVIYATKLFLTLFKKDILRLNFNNDSNTYWIQKKDQKFQSMDNQF